MSPARGFVYGPVPSRRLGLSLGVDVVPINACTYDCIYCQLGPTRTVTTERALFQPVGAILDEVREQLASWPPPDVVTLAGSGEPTLYSGLGELVAGIKRITDVPVALLTNGALLRDAGVRREAALADLVLPSLDAGTEATFELVNRPAPGLTLAGLVEGMAAFRSGFQGEIWLEVMVLAGIQDQADELKAIAGLAARVEPDRIHLNTAVRPTFDARAMPVPRPRLAALCQAFTPTAEVVAEWSTRRHVGSESALLPADEVLALLERRPCTTSDVAAGLDVHRDVALKSLGALERRGVAHRVVADGHVFWHAVKASASEQEARE